MFKLSAALVAIAVPAAATALKIGEGQATDDAASSSLDGMFEFDFGDIGGAGMSLEDIMAGFNAEFGAQLAVDASDNGDVTSAAAAAPNDPHCGLTDKKAVDATQTPTV